MSKGSMNRGTTDFHGGSTGSHKETREIYHCRRDAKRGEGDKEHVHKNVIRRNADGRKPDRNPLFVGVGWGHGLDVCGSENKCVVEPGQVGTIPRTGKNRIPGERGDMNGGQTAFFDSSCYDTREAPWRTNEVDVSVVPSPQKRARWEESDIEDVDGGPAHSDSSGEGGWGTRGHWERSFQKLNRLSLCETGCDDVLLRTKLNLKKRNLSASSPGTAAVACRGGQFL